MTDLSCIVVFPNARHFSLKILSKYYNYAMPDGQIIVQSAIRNIAGRDGFGCSGSVLVERLENAVQTACLILLFPPCELSFVICNSRIRSGFFGCSM